ncbi:MAG: alanine--tRNA ligase [Planctomycetia bacterium]|jgi:alanyl-tRNA synthetase
MSTSNEIRKQFVDFFVKKHGHTFVPSSSVVPHDDPTLLFANAGMNQFKDVFLATGSRPFKRAVNSQKCIRAGGKHNDLDDVGKDTYHHTFFEMLGNWSFGDYFKKEAISWAWELLTKVWGLDRTRLHATVFEGDPHNNILADDEAASFWKNETDIPHNHIHLGNKKDNFWEMGDTGPCGPCTEIHIDLTPDKSGGKLVNKGTPLCIEIWNLVFIQFNRNPDSSLTLLPAKHVDTGMGFERVTAVLQGKNSNYDTDIFTPIFESIRQLSGAPAYTGKLDDLKDTAYRVIGDHIRTLTFAITDGAVPSNEKRGYVLRSVLRRAERFGRQYLGFKKPFLHELCSTVVSGMGDTFPELKASTEKVSKIIFEEEEAFLRTMERGMKLFHEVVERTKSGSGKSIPGSDVFDLHTTFGFFPDITAQMAAEVGLSIDLAGYQDLFEKFKEESGKDRKSQVVSAIQGDIPLTDDSFKYGNLQMEAKILGWIQNHAVTTQGKLEKGQESSLFFDKTCFYPEQGGQVGDSGTLVTPTGKFEIKDTQRIGQGIIHIGVVVEGSISCGQVASIQVSEQRMDIRRNHTATHLLNLALRSTLGNHVEQKGSLVDDRRARFDFSHSKAISPEEILAIEEFVNHQVRGDFKVKAEIMPLEKAKQIPGVQAVFGEKYPDPVRVITIGEPGKNGSSVEFCGGTHLDSTNQVGMFKIISQESVGKGIRRITAVTGKEAWEEFKKTSALIESLSGKLGCNITQLGTKLDSLLEEIKSLKKNVSKGQGSDLAGEMDKLLEKAKIIGTSKVIAGKIPAASSDQIRIHLDRIRQKAGSSIVLVAWDDEGKVGLMISVSDDLQAKGIEAGKLISEIAPAVEGKGGGPKGMAQAGGKNPSKIPDAINKAMELATSKLS